jgi:ribosomal protein S4
MSRRLLRKRNDSFILAQSFPENILPNKKLSKRVYKASSKTTSSLGSMLRRGERSCLQQYFKASSRTPNEEILGWRGKEERSPSTKEGLSTPQPHPHSLEKLSPNLPFQFLFSLDEIKNSLSKGQRRLQRESEFKVRLREKRKIALLYGNLTSRELERDFRKAFNSSGRSLDNLLLILESRLDVTLFRLGFHRSIPAARQCVVHGGVVVNRRILTVPSYKVKAGDILSIHPQSERRVRDQMVNSWMRESFTLSENLANSTGENSFPSRRVSTPWRFHLSPTLLKGIWNQRSIPALSLHELPSLFTQEEEKDRNRLSQDSSKGSSLSLSEGIFRRLGAKRFSAPRTLSLKRKDSPPTSTRGLTPRGEILSKSRTFLISPMKPLHLEVSYKSLTGIVLFSPQKLTFPVTVNPDLVREQILG